MRFKKTRIIIRLSSNPLPDNKIVKVFDAIGGRSNLDHYSDQPRANYAWPGLLAVTVSGQDELIPHLAWPDGPSYDPSNLGSDIIQQRAGEAHYAEMKEAVMEIVRVAFRPEFINRLDEIVVFHPLQQAQIRAIARIQIEYLRRRLADREMGLEVSDAALDHLGEAGFDPVYGARPLKRAIRAQLENPLAQEILSGKFGPGDLIEVGLEHGQLSFERVLQGELV